MLHRSGTAIVLAAFLLFGLVVCPLPEPDDDDVSGDDDSAVEGDPEAHGPFTATYLGWRPTLFGSPCQTAEEMI